MVAVLRLCQCGKPIADNPKNHQLASIVPGRSKYPLAHIQKALKNATLISCFAGTSTRRPRTFYPCPIRLRRDAPYGVYRTGTRRTGKYYTSTLFPEVYQHLLEKCERWLPVAPLQMPTL